MKVKIIVISCLFVQILHAQKKEELFNKVIHTNAIGYGKVYRSALSFDNYVCSIKSLDTLSLKVLGYNSGRYFIEQGACRGYLSEFYIKSTTELEDQVKIVKNKSIEKFLLSRKLKRKKDSVAKVKYRENCQYEINEKDDFTGRQRKHTDNYIVAKARNFLSIQLKGYGGDNSVLFKSIKDLGCVSSYKNNRSSVLLKLKNGKIVTFYHRGKIDCGEFRLTGRLTNSDYTTLSESPIDMIRLNGTDYYSDIKEIDYENIFMDKLKCIKKE